jgi:glycerate 2-kinase
MYDLAKISSYSLNKMIMGESIKRILSAALEVVDPYRSVKTNLEKIFINKTDADGGKRRIIIISFGKAAEPMASAAIDFFENQNIQGIVVTKHPDVLRIGNLEVIKAGHPTPTQQSVRAAEKIVRILSRSNENDITIFLISGGGSSLITKPPVPISLLDIQKLTTLLLKSGASINDVNCIRRHIDRVKGGGLLKHCLSKEIYSFILSDVISNRIEDIASGPTCVDPTTFSDAWRIIQEFRISESIPKSIKEYLLKGINNQIPETIKSINTKEQIVNNVIIGCNRDAAQAAMTQAKQEGFNSTVITTKLNGEASLSGLSLAKKIITLNRSSNIINQPICCIAGGETTVTVKGDGLGGRNLEVALGAVQKLSGQKSIALLTFATDGEDGKTDSAGAIVTGETYTRAMALGLDTEKYLTNNNSYNYFKRLNDLIIVGPTHTNVNDLNLLFIGLH